MEKAAICPTRMAPCTGWNWFTWSVCSSSSMMNATTNRSASSTRTTAVNIYRPMGRFSWPRSPRTLAATPRLDSARVPDNAIAVAI